MDFFRLTMRILSAAIMAYFFMIMAHIVLSWFPANSATLQQIKNTINRFIHPYMKHFQGIRWLRFGLLDFSPVAGLMILSLALYLTQNLAVGNLPGIGSMLALVLEMIWGLLSFILLIFIIIMAVRLIANLFVKDSRPTWMDRIDRLIFPIAMRISNFFSKRTLPYPAALGMSLVLFVVLRFSGLYLLQRYIFPFLSQL